MVTAVQRCHSLVAGGHGGLGAAGFTTPRPRAQRWQVLRVLIERMAGDQHCETIAVMVTLGLFCIPPLTGFILMN